MLGNNFPFPAILFLGAPAGPKFTISDWSEDDDYFEFLFSGPHQSKTLGTLQMFWVGKKSRSDRVPFRVLETQIDHSLAAAGIAPDLTIPNTDKGGIAFDTRPNSPRAFKFGARFLERLGLGLRFGATNVPAYKG